MKPVYRPVEAFNQSFGVRQQKGILRTVVHSWNEGHRSVWSRFGPHVAHDLLAYERRAYVEGNLHSFAKRHKLRKPEPQLNFGRNCYHVELRAELVVLTASAVTKPTDMVRDAIFRRTLARNPQRDLFAFDEPEEEIEEGACVYGIILYGPPSKDADQRFPGFVNVAFPDRDCTAYIETVDLMERYRAEYGELVLHLRRNEGLA